MTHIDEIIYNTVGMKKLSRLTRYIISIISLLLFIGGAIAFGVTYQYHLDIWVYTVISSIALMFLVLFIIFLPKYGRGGMFKPKYSPNFDDDISIKKDQKQIELEQLNKEVEQEEFFKDE